MRKKKATKRPKAPKGAAAKRAKISSVVVREDAFVAALLDGTGKTGAEAARLAGYSPRRAHVAAAELLARPSVQEKIAARQAEVKAKTGITETAVLREAELLAFSNVDHYTQDATGKLVLAPGAPEGAMRAISSIKYRTIYSGTQTERIVEFKLWDKPGMVKILGRHVGAKGFYDRIEHTGDGGGPIQATVSFYIPTNGR